MLSQSDLPIEVAMEAFAEFGVAAAYVVPTATGLSKSIIDAHAGIRAFLTSRGVHDFSTQGQGPGDKEVLPIEVLHRDHSEGRMISLYRPRTKQGDPRLWVRRLGNYAKPGNLLALLASPDGELAIVNCSDPELLASRNDEGSPLNEWLQRGQEKGVVPELMGLLRDISSRGWIESLRLGDTGIGYTLETLLGIDANSSPEPDYKGIELKASRLGPSGIGRHRKNLFSQVPDWKKSRYTSGAALLDAFGTVDPETGLRRLYCTVTSSPNPQGLYFSTDAEADLVEHRVLCDPGPPGEVVRWSLAKLESVLAHKHRETFWVGAHVSLTPSGWEQFHYVKVLHTRGPLVANFLPLVEAGRISMDYTLRERTGRGPRDHGYLFKLSPSHEHLLFPESSVHDLTGVAGA